MISRSQLYVPSFASDLVRGMVVFAVATVWFVETGSMGRLCYATERAIAERFATMADTVTIRIADTSARTGDLVEIPVLVEGASGMSALQVLLTYDPQVLEFSSESSDVIRGEIVPSNAILQAQTNVPGRLPIIFLGGADVANKQVFAVEKDGTLLTLRFKVIGSPGEKSPFGLERAEAFQINEMDLVVETKAGELSVQTEFAWWWAAVAGGVVLVALFVWRLTRGTLRRDPSRPTRNDEPELMAVAEDESIKHQCVGCGRRMTIPSSLIGKKFKCPKCGVSQSSSANAERVDRTPAPKRSGGQYLLLVMLGIGGVCVIVTVSIGATLWYLDQTNRLSNAKTVKADTPSVQADLVETSSAIEPTPSVSHHVPSRVAEPLPRSFQPNLPTTTVPNLAFSSTPVNEATHESPALAATRERLNHRPLDRKPLDDKPLDDNPLDNALFTGQAADEFLAQGRLALEQQDPKQAFALLQRAVALNTLDHAAQMNLGHAARQVRKYRDAVDAYRRATQLDDRDSFGVFCLASSLALAGELDESVTQFKRAIKMNPSLPESYNGLGEVLYARFMANMWRGRNSRQDLTHAAYCFYRAQDIAPEVGRYSENLNWISTHLSEADQQAVGRQLLRSPVPWTDN